MPIYEKPVREFIRDMIAEMGLTRGQIISRQDVIAWFREHYPKVKTGTVVANLIKLSTNDATRLHYHHKLGKDDLFFKIEPGQYRLFDCATDPPPVTKSSAGKASEQAALVPAEEDEEAAKATAFAYERDLRAYLAKNLARLEKGLRLYKDDGITGIEFPAGIGSIDILAIDARGDLVVIELKVSRGYDRVVGQILRYMAWIEENQAEPEQSVRGIIVARSASEELCLACSRVPDVELFEYELSVEVKKVSKPVGHKDA